MRDSEAMGGGGGVCAWPNGTTGPSAAAGTLVPVIRETHGFQAYCGTETAALRQNTRNARWPCSSTTTAFPGSTSRTRSRSRTDEDGRVIEAACPDFYLPEQDLYLEITTMKQSLVTRKNRKIRKLRERYPDLKVRLWYKRDVERLVQKYGLDFAA